MQLIKDQIYALKLYINEIYVITFENYVILC